MNTTTNPTGGPPPGTTGTKGDPNRPLPNPRPLDDGGKGPHYTPWLVVRYAAGDDGSRSLAPGTVFKTQTVMGVPKSMPAGIDRMAYVKLAATAKAVAPRWAEDDIFVV